MASCVGKDIPSCRQKSKDLRTPSTEERKHMNHFITKQVASIE
jgi:hypothetical protein